MHTEQTEVSGRLGACPNALANINGSIDLSKRFPANIFVGNWGSYFFFDSDWIFDAEFANCLNQFCGIEDEQCICLTDVDIKSDIEQEGVLCIDRILTPDSYRLLLKGAVPASGWIYRVDRLACSSDVGQWCIYCERPNEIGVLAIRANAPAEQYEGALAILKAVPIERAIALPGSYGFSELPAHWQTEFVKQYPGNPR